jgi:hypothetical protein
MTIVNKVKVHLQSWVSMQRKVLLSRITKLYIVKPLIVIMNIKSLFTRIRTCCDTSKEEKEKEPKQVIRDKKADFPED